MARNLAVAEHHPPVEEGSAADQGLISYTAVLLTQGRHRFYTLAMPSEVLAETCMVEPRFENPRDGFQRMLDEQRAKDIADYIDSGLGTVPSSIILSAQPEAELQYIRKARTISFKKTPRSFLIIDGQHRVFGFQKAKETLRVPVVIYNRLTRAEEGRLFIDINTKQRPVPPELLLDIKKLAETESDDEALLRAAFDSLNQEPDSPLLGLLSPHERAKGKLSRVTFNAALKSVWYIFSDSDSESVYHVLKEYLHAWLAGLRGHDSEPKITNPTLFKAIMLLFPTVAERVSDRFRGEYTAEHFNQILAPLFRRLKKTELQRPGASHIALHDSFRKRLASGFSLGKPTI